jgi:predicted TIM-barrel fold metal-dependent hydrolase
MKTIDLEAHCYSPGLMRLFEKRSAYPYFTPENYGLFLSKDFSIKSEFKVSNLYDSFEHRIAMMDKYHVGMQILSCSPGIELLTESAEAINAAKEVNDWMYEATRIYPDRFRAFATLPVQDVNAACDELTRCVKKLGFKGWMTFSNYESSYPDDDRYAPLFDKAAELDAIIYLHPTQPYIERLTGLGSQLAAASFGFSIDTSITLMRLILKGVFDRNPGLKLVIGHLGEGFPFILKRMTERAKNYEHAPAVNKEIPSFYFKNNIWITTSGQYSHASFACTAEVLGIDRIMIGTDYPYEYPNEGYEFRRQLVLSEIDREKLFYRNAESLLKL